MSDDQIGSEAQPGALPGEPVHDTSVNLQSGFILGPWTVTPNQNRIEGEGSGDYVAATIRDPLYPLVPAN